MNAHQRRLANANAKRLRSTIVRVGDQPYSFLPQVRQPRLAPTGIIIGQTISTITARSGTTPGSGSVAIQSFDGTSLSDSGNHVTAYNFSANAITGSKYCSLCTWSGFLWIVSVEC